MPANSYTAPLVTMAAISEVVVEPEQSPNRLRELRRDVELPAVALLGDGSIASVTVLNLSYDGCRIKTALALLPGVQFTLSVLGLGKMPASVRWYSDGFAGLSLRAEPIELLTETPRQHKRVLLEAHILLRRSGQRNLGVQTLDVSPSGCRVEFVDRPSVGDRRWVKFDGLDALEAEVRWVAGFTAGVKFIRPIYPAVFELLLARLRALGR